MKKLVTYAAVVSVAIAGGMFMKDAATSSSKTPTQEVANNTSVAEISVESNKLTKAEVVSMGSALELLVYADRDLATVAIKDAVREVRELEALITSWKPSSEVYLINEHSGEHVKVSKVTFDLIKKAIIQSQITEGYFDITVGAVWDLYPFRDKNKVPPTEVELAAAMQFVGYDKIELDEDNLTVSVPRGMKINLGGIGKGEAVNVAMEVFKEHGIENAAISAGGDLTAIGRNGDKPWAVAIADPRWEKADKMLVDIADASIATSGDSERFFYHNGKRYGHIVSPKTGETVTHMQSASVIADDPALADAYATAIYVMGVEKGLAWAEKQKGIKVILINGNGDVVTTPNVK